VYREMQQVFQYVSDGKSKLASALLTKGISIRKDASFDEIYRAVLDIRQENSVGEGTGTGKTENGQEESKGDTNTDNEGNGQEESGESAGTASESEPEETEENTEKSEPEETGESMEKSEPGEGTEEGTETYQSKEESKEGTETYESGEELGTAANLESVQE